MLDFIKSISRSPNKIQIEEARKYLFDLEEPTFIPDLDFDIDLSDFRIDRDGSNQSQELNQLSKEINLVAEKLLNPELKASERTELNYKLDALLTNKENIKNK